MKKFTLIFLSLAFAIVANAQTKLTFDTHSFLPGDKHDFYLTQSADEGKAGANITWDFSGLIPNGKKLTSYMLEPSLTEKGLLANHSNLALQENDNVFYFKVTPSGIEQYGAHSGNSFTEYSEPFVKIKYPFSYGDVVMGNYSGKREANNTSDDVTGTCLLEGDAWGTLILPNGVYNNTLRVKQTRTYNFNSISSEVKEITYRWYSPSVRYPVLVIIKHETGVESSVRQVAYFAHYSNENIKSDLIDASNNLTAIGVSPNPFINSFEVSYNVNTKSQVTIELFDASGNLVTNLLSPSLQDAGKYSKSFTISRPLTSGYYYVNATIGGQTIVKKIVKI